MKQLHITEIEVKRRTFEGKVDPSKNDKILTSKYSPSKRYLLRYKCTEYGDSYRNECYETKKLAEDAKEQMLKYHIDCTQQ